VILPGGTVGAPALEFKPLPPQKPQPKFIPLGPASLQSPRVDQ